jgi:hypothetical protein
MLQKHASSILFFIFTLSFALSVGAMKDDTATFDERAHIPAAYSSVRYGDMRLNPEHPPLLKNLAGLPLLFLRPAFPIESDLWINGITKEWQFGTTMWSTWDLGSAFLYHNGNDTEQLLFWARFPFVLLSLLLGWFVYRSTQELAGTVAGLFAVILCALDPNVLAHNHLVTTDLGIATFIFIATYFFIRFLKDPALKNILFAGLTLGLAELAKFSAVILIPLFGLLVIINSITRTTLAKAPQKQAHSHFKNLFDSLFDYFKILVIAFAIIWIGYLANTWNMPVEKTIQNANLVFAGDALPKTFARTTINTFATTPHLAPIAHYMLGVFMVFSRVTGGNSFYFLGQMPDIASKLYFPIVFFFKETLPFVFLIFTVSILALVRFVKNTITPDKISWRLRFARSFQNNTALSVMFSFVVLYAYLSIAGNLNIGFRHLFPILPFAYVLVTVSLFRFAKSCSHIEKCTYCPTRHLSHILLGAFAFWIIIIPILAFPNYLSYYNEIIGAKNGHIIAVDSNYDWGQNLKRLKLWVDNYNQKCDDTKIQSKQLNACFPNSPVIIPNSPITNLNIDYYGGSEVGLYFTEGSFTPWHSSDKPKSGWFALSATFFEENTHKKLNAGETDYRWLLNYQPVAQAGNSILIFYVSPESLLR